MCVLASLMQQGDSGNPTPRLEYLKGPAFGGADSARTNHPHSGISVSPACVHGCPMTHSHAPTGHSLWTASAPKAPSRRPLTLPRRTPAPSRKAVRSVRKPESASRQAPNPARKPPCFARKPKSRARKVLHLGAQGVLRCARSAATRRARLFAWRARLSGLRARLRERRASLWALPAKFQGFAPRVKGLAPRANSLAGRAKCPACRSEGLANHAKRVAGRSIRLVRRNRLAGAGPLGLVRQPGWVARRGSATVCRPV